MTETGTCRHQHISSFKVFSISTYISFILNSRNGPDCSEPLKSDCFDFFKVSHRIRVSAEVKLQVLHIIQLSEQSKALDKCGLFFYGQVNLTFVLHHFHNTREPLFQIRNLLLNFRVFFAGFPQVSYNITVDLRGERVNQNMCYSSGECASSHRKRPFFIILNDIRRTRL